MTQPTDKLAQVASEVLRLCPFCGRRPDFDGESVCCSDKTKGEGACPASFICVSVAEWSHRVPSPIEAEQAATIARLLALVEEAAEHLEGLAMRLILDGSPAAVVTVNGLIDRLRAEGAP